MSQVVEAEIRNSCLKARLFKGIVNRSPANHISPRPHEEKFPVAMFVQQSKASRQLVYRR
jgi:hypothetical protein